VAITPPWSAFGNRDFGDLPNAEKYKWLEYHKWRFNSDWYTSLGGHFVLRTSIKAGFLGYLNKSIGTPPFNRFQIGGDGLSTFSYNITGKEVISQRGYDIYTNTEGATIFNKYAAELRYPFSTNPSAMVYGVFFVEGANAW
jgi:outer membrane protein insertion porin family